MYHAALCGEPYHVSNKRTATCYFRIENPGHDPLYANRAGLSLPMWKPIDEI